MDDDATEEGLLHQLGSKVKSFQSTLERIVLLSNRERKTAKQFNVPLRRRLWLWRHGFLTEAGVCLDLSEETVDDYLSNYQRDVKTKDINGKTGRVLDDKLAFHQLLEGRFGDYLPELYTYAADGIYYDIEVNPSFDTLEWLLERVEHGSGLVIKPRTGGGGEGIYIIDRLDGEVRINGTPVPLSEVERRLADLDEYLIYERVKQAKYANDIYPGATNTIRALTMIDPETGEPFIATVGHRFGTDTSAPVDNWSNGGISTPIKGESETLGAAIQPQHAGGITWTEQHPDTGSQITGVTVPGWSRVTNELLKIAGHMPYLPYVGWDIVLTGPEGEFKIVEGNRYSDVHVLQVHEPLLADARVRRFYEYHGVI